MLNVAIAVDAPVDYGPAAVRVVAAACAEVIGEGRCPVAAELPPGAVVAWYAVVHPTDRALSGVHIAFRDRTAEGVLIEERTLAFGAADSGESRLSSVGTVIAALAAAREGALPLQARSVVGNPAALALRDDATRAAPPAGWSVDLAAVAEPTVADTPYRVGGLARAHLDINESLFGVASAGYAASFGTPRLGWWELSAGAGLRFGARASRFGVEVSAQGLFQRVTAAAMQNGDSANAAQNAWGGALGIDAVWSAGHHYAPFMGLEGSAVLPRIDVVVGNGPAEHVPALNAALRVGVRLLP